jgi:hypothetical protein
MQPTIILVHGAFESSSWDAAIDRLLDTGHPVTATQLIVEVAASRVAA